MPSAPTVSVLMPVYNAARYVAEAVESILAQTFRDFEFLIINDGSTDGSAMILGGYAGRDSRIRLISRPNVGIVGTLNELVAMARGEYLARMDADDVAMPGRLASQVAYLRDHPECLVVGGRVLAIDPDGDPLCEWGGERTHEEIDAVLLSTDRGAGLIHPAVMMRREAVLAVGGYRDRPAEDKDLFLRLGERGRLANLPEVLLRYRQHPSSLCHDAHNEALGRAVLQTVQEAHERRGLDGRRISPPGLRPHATPAEVHLKWGWWALMAGYAKTARKHAWGRLRNAPLSVHSWRLLACALRGH